MASTASTAATGFALIGVYTLGFVLPFLAVGLFTRNTARLLQKHQKVVQYTVKVGGALMIVMGIMMITGWMNGITGYLSSFGGGSGASVSSSVSTPGESQSSTGGAAAGGTTSAAESSAVSAEKPRKSRARLHADRSMREGAHPCPTTKGKVVFLNFWATWCGPCRQEMPDIQSLYERYGGNKGGPRRPRRGQSQNRRPAPRTRTVPSEEVTAFLEEGGYSYPVVMDTSGSVFLQLWDHRFPHHLYDRQRRQRLWLH